MVEHPGLKFRREVLVPSGINISEFSRLMGIRRETLSLFLYGELRMTASCAVKIQKVLGSRFDPLRWMKLQAAYDLEVAKAELHKAA